MARGVNRPVGIRSHGPTEVYELLGGPLDGQRWELSVGTAGFGLSLSAGTVHVYEAGASPARLDYRGEEPDEGGD